MILRFLFLILIICCFNSCRKDEPSDPNQEKMNLLTSKVWKRSLKDDNPASNPSGTFTYYPAQQCELDDSYNFGSNNQLTVLSGELKCDPNDSITSTTDFSIDLEAETIIIRGGIFNLEELTETQLKYSAPIPYGSNSTSNIVFIFKH